MSPKRKIPPQTSKYTKKQEECLIKTGIIKPRPTTYMTYRMFRSETVLPNREKVLDRDGAITACCVIDTVTKKMNVGFAFMSPNDQQLLKKGRDRAYGRCQQDPVTMKIKRDGKKLLVAETILDYLFKAWDKKTPEKMLHISPYNGKPEKNKFRPWFDAFMDSMWTGP